MKIKKIIFLIVLTTLFSVSSFAQGDPPPPVGDEFDQPALPDNRGQVIARVLGLSNEQKIQIRNINQNQRLQLQSANERLKNARANADKVIYQDTLDEALVEIVIRDVALAEAEITRIRMKSEIAMRNLLSPEQLVKFRKLRAQFEARRQNAEQIRKDRQQRRRQQGNPRDRMPPPPPR